MKRIFKRYLKNSTRRSLHALRYSITVFWADVWNEELHQNRKFIPNDEKSILVHFACGERYVEGWVNCDIKPNRPEVFYCNATNGLPFRSGSVRRLHCEHFLEHLEFDQAESFLQECFRILEPEGEVRIIVPDAGKYMRAYAANDQKFFQQLERLGGTAEPLPSAAAICNQMFRMGGDHKFGWDFETLELICRKIKFRGCALSTWCDPTDELQIDGLDWWRPVESMYVLLTK